MKLQLTEEKSLLDALTQLAPESSKSTLRSWLKDERVFVDGIVEKIGSKILKKGQIVSLGARKAAPIDDGLRILYEDSHVVVVDKPSSMLSVAAAFDKTKTAHAILKNHYRPNKVYVVHRLDQDTSGVMLFALSEKAHEKLKKIFEEHAIVRQYVAVIEGRLPESQGTWQSYLYEDDFYTVHVTSDETRGRLAITHYEVLEATRAYSLVRFTLETGRKNQIRVHCQEAGHSIVGDTKYGASRNPVKRLCLHAQLLEFKHPLTGKKMHFESSIPTEFKKLMKPHA